MTDGPLTTDRILDTAEDVLRRFGLAKTTVVDVARALDVSHGTIYRHYPSKAALRDAVAERWLHRVVAPLVPIAEAEGPAPERLRRWFEQLMATKRRKVLDDPELFATYSALAEQSGPVIQTHVEELLGQLERIIADGVAQGVFVAPDVPRAARAIFSATVRFHNPKHAAEWSNPRIDEDFAEIWRFVLAGLTAGGNGQ